MNMWDRYGADTVRGYLMLIGPWDLGGPWDPKAIEGINRFLNRVWNVVMDEPQVALVAAEPTQDETRAVERKLHQTMIKVNDDLANFRFNTAIAALMEMNNLLVRAKGDRCGRLPHLAGSHPNPTAADGAHLPTH